MVRRLMKSAVAGGLRWSGASLAARALMARSGAFWIVGYHRVVADFAACASDSIHAALISGAMLERHLDWIGRRFDFVPLDAIADRLENGGAFRRPAAAVTFDDGYRDLYDQAFPILKAKGIPATLFVLSDLVGTRSLPLHDRLHHLLDRARSRWGPPMRELDRILSDLGHGMPPAAGAPAAGGGDPHRAMRLLMEALPQSPLERVAARLEDEVGVDDRVVAAHRPLTWEMLIEMQRAGITVGSHSRTHPLLTREDPEKVLDEIAGSRRLLETRLGAPVRHFAYPNGWFDGRTIRMVEAAGYRSASTSCRHRDPIRPLLTLPRTLLWENSSLGLFGTFSPAMMGCLADGTLDRFAGCSLEH